MAKKIKRLLLSVDEPTERVVKDLADIEDRPYEYQLRWVIRIGLKHELRRLRKESPSRSVQLPASLRMGGVNHGNHR